MCETLKLKKGVPAKQAVHAVQAKKTRFCKEKEEQKQKQKAPVMQAVLGRGDGKGSLGFLECDFGRTGNKPKILTVLTILAVFALFMISVAETIASPIICSLKTLFYKHAKIKLNFNVG